MNNQSKDLWSKPKRRGEIAWMILQIIAEVPEAIAHGFLDRGLIHSNIPSQTVRRRLSSHLGSLRRSRYIETKIVNRSLSVRLTDRGVIKLMENPRQKLSDGKIRAVSYDIPQALSSKRISFCRHLRRMGFLQLQKSLWICRYAKADKIDTLIRELGLEEYVAYFIIEKSNIDEYINKKVTSKDA